MGQKFIKTDADGIPLAFYDEEVHGPKVLNIPDPDFQPTEDNPEPPFIEVPNPDCRIPEDAAPISSEVWAELLQYPGLRKFIDGEVVVHTPLPPSAQQIALGQILELEGQITSRRIREAILGTDNGWLAGIEEQISVLRGQL